MAASDIFTTTLSGVTVASAFYLDRSHRTLVVLVPSMAAARVQVEFAPASLGPYGTLFRLDGHAGGRERATGVPRAGRVRGRTSAAPGRPAGRRLLRLSLRLARG